MTIKLVILILSTLVKVITCQEQENEVGVLCLVNGSPNRCKTGCCVEDTKTTCCYEKKHVPESTPVVGFFIGGVVVMCVILFIIAYVVYLDNKLSKNQRGSEDQENNAESHPKVHGNV